MLVKYRAWFNDGTPDGYCVYWTSTQIDDPLADFTYGDPATFSDFTIIEFVGDSGTSFERQILWEQGVQENELVYIAAGSANTASALIGYTSIVNGIATKQNKVSVGGICAVKLEPQMYPIYTGQRMYLSQSYPGCATDYVTYEANDVVVFIGYALENTEAGALTCLILFHPSDPIYIEESFSLPN